MTASVIRRYRRFPDWDYARGASLFITLATEPRRALFGRVVGGAVLLSPLGEKVWAALGAMPKLNPGLLIFGFVVMPDHIHFNCALVAGLDEPLKVLGNAIRRFKNYITAEAKRSLAVKVVGAEALDEGARAGVANNDGRTAFGRIWQQGYHDYLLVSRQMIDSTERYIAYNPLKWELMYGVADALRIHEPLHSPRLDVGDYWKGVGNVALLGEEERLVALWVSREIVAPGEIARLLAKMKSAADKGWVVVSGFISKGEWAVRDMLCRKKGAKLIKIRPSSIPNARFRPESVYVDAFAEGRCLEIGRGNDEVEFGRRACLDLNAEAVEIATAANGLAVYWKDDGPHGIANGETGRLALARRRGRFGIIRGR